MRVLVLRALGCAPPEQAVHAREASTVKELLEAGAAPWVSTKRELDMGPGREHFMVLPSDMPLCLAAMGDDMGVLEALVQAVLRARHGNSPSAFANGRQPLEQQDHEGRTALACAVQHGRWAAAAALAHAGALVLTPVGRGDSQSIFRRLLQVGRPPAPGCCGAR